MKRRTMKKRWARRNEVVAKERRRERDDHRRWALIAHLRQVYRHATRRWEAEKEGTE